MDQQAQPERHFGIPLRSAEEQVVRAAPPAALQAFQPLPTPTGAAPYRLDLGLVLGPDRLAAIHHAGQLCFHCVGDTGGVKAPQPQESVAAQLVADLTGAAAPAFLYHLGDVVYFNGQ